MSECNLKQQIFISQSKCNGFFAEHCLMTLSNIEHDEIGKITNFGHKKGSAKDFASINQFIFSVLCFSPYVN